LRFPGRLSAWLSQASRDKGGAAPRIGARPHLAGRRLAVRKPPTFFACLFYNHRLPVCTICPGDPTLSGWTGARPTTRTGTTN